MLQVLGVVIHYISVQEIRTLVLTQSAADTARTSCAVLVCPDSRVQRGDKRALQPPARSTDIQVCTPQQAVLLGRGKGDQEHPVCRGGLSGYGAFANRTVQVTDAVVGRQRLKQRVLNKCSCCCYLKSSGRSRSQGDKRRKTSERNPSAQTPAVPSSPWEAALLRSCHGVVLRKAASRGVAAGGCRGPLAGCGPIKKANDLLEIEGKASLFNHSVA